jgi:uncharacterized protein YkwD
MIKHTSGINMGALTNILLLIVIVALVIIFYPKLVMVAQLLGTIISSYHTGSSVTFPNSTQYNQSSQNVTSGPAANYVLYLINKDRATYGLSNVTLSSTTSGQQHAQSMLQYNYFSHWDVYGMKPYMRYTLVGGKGAVQENVAYTKSGVQACLGSICSTYGNLNVSAALKNMEYNMVYNDSACCNNGHRDNILNPYHNQVSIGVAQNSTTVYLVEDFVNNYITWFNSTPSISNNGVSLEGAINSTYSLSSVQISYDPTVVNMSQSQLDQTSDYGYGQAVAGVVSNPLDYYPGLTTISADTYYTQGNDFLVSFDMSKLISQYGAGEYTVAVWLNGTTSNSTFIGSTYTIFINNNGSVYAPSNV